MSTLAIRVENLSKLYKIGARRNRHDTLRDHLAHGFKSLFSRNGRSSSLASQPSTLSGQQSAVSGHPSLVDGRSDTFWALKDVSFEVKKGEVIGIIGRNGAGKSTLLKILSRITQPTSGSGEIHGRVGSLLEVGTGFHPELTGRENIYLNGAVMGMRKAGIERRFDKIVDFSGVEKFIDTPVKRYSSGMYVRLAFAVAAHLEPEILLVDEVLAVGDSAFQLKCLERIRELTGNGSTTLVVSHNMGNIQNLCARTLWLETASLSYDGKTAQAVNLYVDRTNHIAEATVGRYLYEATRRGTGEVRFTNVEVVDANGFPTTELRMRDDMRIRVKYRAFREVCSPEISFAVRDVETGVVVTSFRKRGIIPDLTAGQEGMVECVLESIPFRPRRYALYLGLRDSDYRRAAYDAWDGAGPDIVVSSDGMAADGEFIVGLDTSLVAVSHRVRNITTSLGEENHELICEANSTRNYKPQGTEK